MNIQAFKDSNIGIKETVPIQLNGVGTGNTALLTDDEVDAMMGKFFLGIYAQMYIHPFACSCMNIYIYVYMYIHTCFCLFAHTYIYMRICI
jgi:hypothetical protein